MSFRTLETETQPLLKFIHAEMRKHAHAGEVNMKLDIQVMKTEKTPEKMFAVELTGDRSKDLASFEKLSIELYMWACDEGLYEEPK